MYESKYIGAPVPGATFPPGGANCGPLGEWAGALAWDVVNMTCWKVEGLAITIGPFTASLQGAMEVFNRNVAMNGNQPPVVNVLQLNKMGPVIV